MKKLSIGLFAASFVATLLFAMSVNAASTERQVDDNLKTFNDRLRQEIENKTALSFSSNPYDYIKGSVEFQNIIALGNDALPVLEQKIDESPGSGLNDYLLSIAAEEISKVSLKRTGDSSWSTGDEFSVKWKSHLKAIPAKVEQIVSSSKSADEKVSDLRELGTPALPFIVDQIEQGNVDIAPTVNALLNSANGISTFSAETIDQEWATKHKAQFEKLRSYVESKK
ncbi:conserved hypothetical protein [Paenibacillus curdlanolyticus YK9]|uniref:Uncharacterized protein n=1 Tax=Paenibacillus curdlanolyticus YK9 TaxID=717606 RepID=E0IDJ3_9BACL|nr:hypothetical protein [Paenibacillus curdlanolyticus]EFM09648.1 conserved hypothetical protein [Paenibacillus curdlanolyticus YK9]